MNKPLFTGVCTALVTPFLYDKINYPMLQQLIERQIKAGIQAIVIAGTTGESPTLSDSEKIELFCKCKEFAGDRCLVIAGTGSNDTVHAVRLSKAAQQAGADALLVVSPYYNKATPGGLISHYMSIANSADIPIILYNVPSRTGVDIPVSVYQRLSLVEHITGVKEASPDITKVTKIRRLCHPNFCVWSGNDDQTVPALSLGAKGVISVLSNVCPEETVVMTQSALNGDYQTASALQCRLSELIDLLFCEVNPIPVKAAMQMIGYDCGSCRLPLSQLTPESYEKLKAYFRA